MKRNIAFESEEIYVRTFNLSINLLKYKRGPNISENQAFYIYKYINLKSSVKPITRIEL